MVCSCFFARVSLTGETFNGLKIGGQKQKDSITTIARCRRLKYTDCPESLFAKTWAKDLQQSQKDMQMGSKTAASEQIEQKKKVRIRFCSMSRLNDVRESKGAACNSCSRSRSSSSSNDRDGQLSQAWCIIAKDEDKRNDQLEKV